MKEEHRRLRSLPIWKVLLFEWAVNLKHGEVFQICTSAGEAKIWCYPSYRRWSEQSTWDRCCTQARRFILRHGVINLLCGNEERYHSFSCERMKHILLYASRGHYFSASGDRGRQFDSVVIVLDYLIMRALRSGSSILFVSALIYTEYRNPME
ncbi:hypothetical protein MKW98_007398 [Papaver atlanticum]|uniref:Uncharacterized protein n=1 Tax=Papaver atlanticum TaxID=357466 RepID=A0AAD4SCE7_9MAGN|nr:hypothetical protein MKW98_007398 [Papaver atlanticum]